MPKKSQPSNPASSASSDSSALPELPSSYEAALQELEQLIAQIESGQLPLSALLTGYQRGAQLLGFCREQLTAVENQVSVLEQNQIKPWTAS